MKSKQALVVIDFINDIVHLQGKFKATAQFCHSHHVISKANQAIAFARQNAISIVFVKVGFSENYLECPSTSPIFGKAKENKALLLDSWGTDFHQDLAFHPDDFVIIKKRISAFYGTPLDLFLRANRIEHLFFAGVSTDLAIQTTVREAHDRDYQVTLLSDACGAESLETHLFTIKELHKLASIITVETFCD